MNTHFSLQQIRVYAPDGNTRLFTQSNLMLANQALRELNPAKLFAENALKIFDDDGEFTFAAAEVQRIDLITDRLSVWDFPFIIGTHVELTEGEFRGCVGALQRGKPTSSAAMPVYISVEMTAGQRYFFWMQAIGGLGAIRANGIGSVIQMPQLVFGLRTGGVGILNLAHMENFSIYPEPTPVNEGQKSELFAFSR